MSSFTLTRGELLDLTGKTQVEAQKAALRKMGIDFYVRPDESLAVLRSVAERGEDTSHPTPELNLSDA